ncbi:MAG: enoyl-CoA hydratase/isomerase family protein [Parvularculaceae bacterium]
MTEDVLFSRNGHLGVITLNRPKALNALTRDMAAAITSQLDLWTEDESVGAVLIKGAPGSRAFCAGGDIKRLYEGREGGNPFAKDFFRTEYTMNVAIKRFSKPYIALLHGIVMGGGFGLSVHGSHRVVGDDVTFAMPETGIGMFPDVGGSYVLPRLKSAFGFYLALTGARLKADDTVYCGVGTHRVSSEKFAALEAALAGANLADDPFATVDAVISGFAAPVDGAPLRDIESDVARLFDKEMLDEILVGLEQEETDWARGLRDAIGRMSPISTKITFEELICGKDLSFEDCMRMEYRIACRIVEGHDFYEGVRAVVIDKDNAPKWSPVALDDVTDEMVDEYFMPLGDEELQLPNNSG